MPRLSASAAVPFYKFPEADHLWIASTASDDLGLHFEMHLTGNDRGEFLYVFSPHDERGREPWYLLALANGVSSEKISERRGPMDELQTVVGPASEFSSLAAALASIVADRGGRPALH